MVLQDGVSCMVSLVSAREASQGWSIRANEQGTGSHRSASRWKSYVRNGDAFNTVLAQSKWSGCRRSSLLSDSRRRFPEPPPLMEHGVRPLGIVRLNHRIFITDNSVKGLQIFRCEVTNERKRVVPERGACLRITIRPMHSTPPACGLEKVS